MKKSILFLFFILAGMMNSFSQTPAFPGAEGGGMYASGGRGGEVYFVNSLEDTIAGNKKTKEGTLRWCLKRKGPKTIVFKVGGLIRLKSELIIPDSTTVAGQTAPGDGICIADDDVRIRGNNVIVRFLRFRLGDRFGVIEDAFSGKGGENIIVDHCSMSWSTDECGSFYDNRNFTMQWCILSESLTNSVHTKGSHGFGGIWGGKGASFHHNLLAHHNSRNPRMCGSRYSNKADEELVDFRNNVIYNWGTNSGYAGEGGRYNFVNNYYKPTEYTNNKNRIFQPNADDGTNKQPAGIWGEFYLSGNYMNGSPDVTADNRIGFQPNPSSKDKTELLSDTEFSVYPVFTHAADVAYEKVLTYAGASLKRDGTDMRVINEVKDGSAPMRASKGTTRGGLIDSQSDVGGWDTYSFSSSEVPDYGKDGLPAGWLKKNHPGKTARDTNEEGYTYLEVYLNDLVKGITGGQK